MKLSIFRSSKGDCLLLTSKDSKRILIDGGMSYSYRDHVAPYLEDLHNSGEALDVVYVSHIDQDHISGVLTLLDDLVDWRVHEHHLANGHSTHPQPGSHRPPEIGQIWHNAFHEQIGKNAGAIEDLLAAKAAVLSGHAELEEEWERHTNFVNSKREAILVSRRISDRQLNIPLNPEYDGYLMYVADDPAPLPVGSLKCHVVGPYASDLAALKAEWNDWLRDNRKLLRKIEREAREDEDRLKTDVERLLHPLLAQAHQLGRRDLVTPANLASLMFLIEEDGKTVLLTGDGHWEDVLAGLGDAGLLDQHDRLHVDVLKVPHHGSEHNTHPDFCKAITADHYVFCGNGAHENPDHRVVKAYLDSRVGTASQRSRNAKAGNRFKLWFNSHHSVESNAARRRHMQEVERRVERRAQQANGRFSSVFMTQSRREFTV